MIRPRGIQEKITGGEPPPGFEQTTTNSAGLTVPSRRLFRSGTSRFLGKSDIPCNSHWLAGCTLELLVKCFTPLNCHLRSNEVEIKQAFQYLKRPRSLARGRARIPARQWTLSRSG